MVWHAPKVSEGSVGVSWMQMHHQEYFKEAGAVPTHQDFVVTLGGLGVF